jgi:flagellar basal-body rod protein FlgB
MIAGLLDSGALPTLERVAQFTGRRHKVLVEGIANLSTPLVQPRDLDVEGFQAELRRALDDRRSTKNPTRGPLELRDTQDVKFKTDRLGVDPARSNHNILFHDRNNRDLERTMQHLAENTLMHNTSMELLKNQFSMLRTAIRERM